MEANNTTFLKFFNKGTLNIRVTKNNQKFKDIKIKYDLKEEEKYKKYKYELGEEKEENNFELNYYLNVIKDNSIIRKEKIYLLNVIYYIKIEPFLKRLDNKPFYSYIDKKIFNLEDIKDLIKREKIKNEIISIKIKVKNNFENMKEKKLYTIDKSEFIILEFYLKRKRDIKNNKINKYHNDIFQLNKRLNKYSEKLRKYDLIYLYASPLYESENRPTQFTQRISYREEMKVIIDLMKKSKKKFECLFQWAGAKVLKDIISIKKTKILQISSHGRKKENYQLVLENSDGCQQKVDKIFLKNILENNKKEIKNIDLIILTSCYSGCFQELFEQAECCPKYIIYVDRNEEINDLVCVYFTEFFYSELIEGNSIDVSFDIAIEKLKKNSEILSGVKEPFKEIQKLKIFKKKELNIKPFEFNDDGELIINKNVKMNFNARKYRSMIGRNDVIVKVYKDLVNNEHIKYTVIYGKKGTGKLDFAESLCVFLFERDIIYDYEIFNEIEDIIIESIEIKIKEIEKKKKYNNKKMILIVNIYQDEKLVKKIVNKYKNNYYFIFLIDKEKLNEIKDNCFDSLIKEDNAIMLFEELSKNYGRPINNDDGKFNGIFEDLNELKTINKLFDYYIKEGKLIKVSELKKMKEMKIKIEKKSLTPICAFLFLLSKMPDGLPDCIVQIIFDKEIDESFNDDSISKHTMNKWNYINTEIEFEEKYEKYYIRHFLKLLKLYCKLLCFNIEKDRKEIKYPDENIHLIFNSYNNEGIWKSNIPNIKDEENINENEFIGKDFNIQKHKENIFYLINYLVDKLHYFYEQYIYIEYLIEILLLFPSYFFLKKICKLYIKKSIEFCNKCLDFYENKGVKKIEDINENKDLIEKINKDNYLLLEEIKKEIEKFSEKYKDIKNNYEKLKNNNINNINNKNEEIKKKLIYQKAKLSLFLYSISNEEIKEFPEYEDLQLELNLLQFMKNEKKTLDYIENNKNIFLSEEKKSILYYKLASKCYLQDKKKAKSYLTKALEISKRIKGNRFIEHRIEIDLAYIFIKEIKINEENKNNEEIMEKIEMLNNLMKNYNNKLYNEEYHLREEFYELINPNTIMLNANPLNNGFDILSSGIHALPNNQYYILEKLKEKEKIMNGYLRIKSYILNEDNLKNVLKKKGEILIIQSDDFSINGDIIMESDEGISKKLDINKFIKIIENNSNKINFRIVILGFIYSDKFVDYIKDKIEYEYLIYFKTFDFDTIDINNKYLKFNQLIVEFIINFISTYNENNIGNFFSKENFNKILENNDLKNYFFWDSVSKNTNNTQFINKIKNKGIFFSESLLNLQKPELIKNKEYKYDSNEMLKIIKKIKEGENPKIYCNKLMKEKYLNMGFEIIKYFYRHKTFFQYYIIDIENEGESELINIENTKGYNKKFYLIYNCRYLSDEILNYLKIIKISYIIIYDDENKDEDEIKENDNYKLKENENSENNNFSIFELNNENNESEKESDSEKNY